MDFGEYVQHKSCFDKFSNRLFQVCDQQSHNLEIAGADGHGNDIYRVILNSDANETVAFLGGIHGNEKAGPLAILNFLENPPETDFRVMLMPVVNPYGFDNHIRRNGRNRDLNRNWCDDDLYEENQAIVSSMGGVKFLVTLHEDPKEEGFYLYYSDYARTPFYKKLVELGRQYLPVKKERIVYGDRLVNGLVPKIDMNKAKHSCCVETFFMKQGVHYLTVETPGRQSVVDRVRFQRKAMDFALSHLAKKSS